MAGVWGIGSKFQAKFDEVWTTLGSITDLKIPNTSRDVQDATTLDSPDETEEKMVTVKRRGDGSVTINNDPSANYLSNYEGALDSGGLIPFRAIYPNGDDYVEFKAYVTNVDEGSITPDGLLTATITLTASGPQERGVGGGGETTLTTLQIGELDLNPRFRPNTTLYTVTTANEKDNVLAVKKDIAAEVTIEVNNATHVNDTEANWESGLNEVVVTVTSGTKSAKYTVFVTCTA